MYFAADRYGFLTILFKRRRLVLRIFFSILALGIAYLIIAERKYESVSQLIVRFGNRSVPEVERAPATELTPSDRREIVLSHVAILKSPDLARATLEAVDIKNIYPDIIENPPGGWSIMDEAVRRFRDSLWVGVGTQDNVVSISFQHPDGSVAQQVVQKLITAYNGQQTVVYNDPHSAFLKGEVAASQNRLNEAQAALDKFKTEWRITNYDEEINDLLKQRGEVNSSLHVAQANLDQARNRKAELARLMKNVPRTITESASGEKYRSIDEAHSRLAELQNKRSQMLATYKANSPMLSTLNAGIADAKSEVASRQRDLERRAPNINSVYQTVETDYLRASADATSNAEPVAVLTSQRNAIDQRLDDLRKSRGEFDDLVRERTLAEDLYKSLTTQHEDARVKDSLNQNRISSVAVISQPSLPYKPSRPRRLITLLVTLFAGGILGVAAALIREAMDDRITTPEQLEGIVDMPVLASLDQRRRTFTRLLASPEAAT